MINWFHCHLAFYHAESMLKSRKVGVFRENVLLRYHALSCFRVEARAICCELDVFSVAAHKLVTRFLFFNLFASM